MKFPPKIDKKIKPKQLSEIKGIKPDTTRSVSPHMQRPSKIPTLPTLPKHKTLSNNTSTIKHEPLDKNIELTRISQP